MNQVSTFIKSKNPIQKQSHIVELSACILNIFGFCVFMSNKPFDFFRNMFNTKTVKVNNFIIFTHKAIQYVPTSAYSSRFITHAPFFIVLGKLSLE